VVGVYHQATTWLSRPLTVGMCTWFRGGDAVGLSPNIRIYRYKPKQFFDAHCRLNWLKHDSCFLSLLLPRPCCSAIWLLQRTWIDRWTGRDPSGLD
jgi:hypothetical protein